MRMEASGLTRAVERASELFETRKGDEEACLSTTTSSSSIGNDSDANASSSETESAENEAHSPYNDPLDMMDSLEEVLPIRRGISKFYNGKSKSFTSLADSSSSPSVKDIVKPENAYTRRRRNLMAFHHGWDKNRNFPLRNNSVSGGISKRTISSSRSTLALAFALNYDSCSSCTSEDSTSSSNSRSPSPRLPPLHPRIRVSSASAGPSSPLQQNFSSSWRSFSFADLQHCATASTIKLPASTLGNEAANPS